jgi:hypothetical protein
MPDRETIVIISGSAAGPSAAAKAKRVNPDLESYKDDEADFKRSRIAFSYISY